MPHTFATDCTNWKPFRFPIHIHRRHRCRRTANAIRWIAFASSSRAVGATATATATATPPPAASDHIRRTHNVDAAVGRWQPVTDANRCRTRRPQMSAVCARVPHANVPERAYAQRTLDIDLREYRRKTQTYDSSDDHIIIFVFAIKTVVHLMLIMKCVCVCCVWVLSLCS